MAELIRLSIEVEEDDVEVLLGLLALNVPHGWEEQSLSTGQTLCVVHSGHAGFCEELVTSITSVLPGASIRRENVKEQNWAEAWKEFFTPVEGGEHFLVLAPWMQEEAQKTERIVVFIEPKMAFGTGHHATTSLCLEAISSLYAAGEITKDCKFLDLGTGSGILGIACAKLGLHGHGVDIEAASVENATENRTLNNIDAGQFSIALGGIEAAGQDYDLILANILAAPLRDMAEQIVAAMSKNAGKNTGVRPRLVLSGMLDIQAESVESIYVQLGLQRPLKLQRGEWVALVF